MRRVPRVVTYAGLGLSLVLLMYSCSVEKGRIHEHVADASSGRMLLFLLGAVAMLAAIVIVALYDIKQVAGDEAFDLVADPDEEAAANPEAEMAEAEQVRKTDPLEAVRLLREFLNQHPGQAQVMTRIAEIYEKDLHNSLAAALEYEELLKLKLDSETWGRSAIHLTNLYIRLQQQEKAIALLRRIDRECAHTPAGLKARRRLEQLGE